MVLYSLYQGYTYIVIDDSEMMRVMAARKIIRVFRHRSAGPNTFIEFFTKDI